MYNVLWIYVCLWIQECVFVWDYLPFVSSIYKCIDYFAFLCMFLCNALLLLVYLMAIVTKFFPPKILLLLTHYGFHSKKELKYCYILIKYIQMRVQTHHHHFDVHFSCLHESSGAYWSRFFYVRMPFLSSVLTRFSQTFSLKIGDERHHLYGNDTHLRQLYIKARRQMYTYTSVQACMHTCTFRWHQLAYEAL